MPAAASGAIAWMFAIAAFCMPLKTAFVTTTFTLLAIAAALFHAVFRPMRGGLRLSGVSWLAVALFCWAVIRMSGTSASGAEALASLLDLHELLVLPLLASLPLAAVQRERAIRAFVAGNLAAAGVSYAKFSGLLAIVRSPPVMYEPPQGTIAGSWMMGLAVFLCVMLARRAPVRVAALWLGAAALMLGVLLVLTAGRTGYVTLIVLGALSIPFLSRRQLGFAALMLAAFVALGWQFSPVMRDRVAETFDAAPAQEPVTSTEIRREIYRVATLAMLDAPFAGHGTGSFRSVFRAKAQEIGSPVEPVGNPHNEYLHLWIETGAPGVALLLGLLVAAWRQSRELDEFSRSLARALVLTMGVSCLFNSFLHDASPGRAFVLLLALAISGVAAGRASASRGPAVDACGEAR